MSKTDAIPNPIIYDKKITRFGYIVNKKSLSPDLLLEIKADLTVKPFKQGSFGKTSKSDEFSIYLENGDYIGIPKYYGLEKLGPPDVDKVSMYEYPPYPMNFTGKLRPRQQIIIDNVIKGLNSGGGGLIVAQCGIGKSILAIYLACYYKVKTLFLTHKTFLKNQIIKRAQAVSNISSIGTIQGKKIIDTGHPFVVAMVQSVSKIDYDDKIFKDFGMVIIDEVHHMGARNFSKFFHRISAKYMLGISAEDERPDKLYKIINWYMGPILHHEKELPNSMVVVKKYHYKTSNEYRIRTIVNKYTQEPDRSTMITNLIKIKFRNRFILNIINNLFSLGKNMLFLSGRIMQVNILYILLNQEGFKTKDLVGKYLGGMSEAELDISSTKPIILGTYDMAQEGLDIENLNAVIFSTPKSSIKQSVGRILRKDVFEENPIVIDIVDEDNKIFQIQSKNRDRYYATRKFNIQHFNVSDYDLENYNLYSDNKFIEDSIKKIPTKREREEKRPNVKIDLSLIDFASDSDSDEE